MKKLYRSKYPIGEVLKNARESRGLSLIDVAKQMGCSYQQVSKYEQDVNSPSFGYLVDFTEKLSLDFSIFLPHSNVREYSPEIINILGVLSVESQGHLARFLKGVVHEIS